MKAATKLSQQTTTIQMALEHLKLGHLNNLLSQIRPAFDTTIHAGQRSSDNKEFVQKVAHKNVRLALRKVKTNSSVLSEVLNRKK